MNFEKGDTYKKEDAFTSGIDVDNWGHRIECYGNTEQEAETLRAKVLAAISNEAPERLAQAVENFTNMLTQVQHHAINGGQLTFKKFAETNLQRCNRWHPRGIKSWPLERWSNALAGEGGETAEAVAQLSELALKLVGKIGQVANAVKKANRVQDGMVQKQGPRGWQEAVDNITKEIGDVAAYLDLLAQRIGVPLETCIATAFNQISEREGFPERL